MRKRSTDHLIQLISRMSPSEKRRFKLSANRNSTKSDLLFIQLFDFLDKSRSYDEEKLLKKVPLIKKEQLSNLKSNLYKQILGSLRSQMKNNISSISIREQQDYALVLHSKGLYRAALDLLDKTKKAALASQRNLSVLSVLEIEKHIEGLYVTGSMYPKAKVLKEESEEALKMVTLNHTLSNLSLSLYGLYLQYGYVKDTAGFDFITDYFRQHLPPLNFNELDFYGKIYYHQSHVWYYYMIQDFANNYKYAQKWVDLFIENPKWQVKELTIYIKGLHNVLNALFMAQRYDKFAPMYDELLRIGDEHLDRMNRDQLSNFKLIEHTHGINQFFLTGNFADGGQYVKQIVDTIETNTFDWDLNRIILFNYKIASIYFCNGDLPHTVAHLHKITNEVYPDFREDIQCAARILNLIAHFDLGNESLVKHQIKSTFRYLSKVEHLQPALRSILSFVRRTPNIRKDDLKKEFSKLRSDLAKLERIQFERRPFLYLDIIAWLDSKIEEIPIGDIIKRKMIGSQKH